MRRSFFAFASGLAFFAITAAQAWAGPYMSWGQWTSDPGVAFAQCWDRGAQALASAGLSSSQDGRFFHGSNNAFTASLICYDLGNRFIVTITVAQSLGTENNGMTTDQVRDRMAAVIFGSGGANLPGTNTAGGTSSWAWTATCNGSNYSGTFTISNLQADGTFNGGFTDNGYSAYNGTIAGQIRGAAISFTRRWNTADSQQWYGTFQSGSTMSGNITGFGAPCTFSAGKQ